ncbi:DoxX-like family protein [Leptospira broomii serovar Hurstbridge str. 5399]|uniref:DoxX-like family protein n=3 Tax=Leptospira TaxID=171 RepID=V6HTD9_9LEPT|nr:MULTISPECIES: DoxX family protein [Leptospira]EQA35954.1 DoxX-like family protein [Leptospira inadai serovar Lyme str. 10]EQA46627.1 DoxX-like family protein [Leptospira broomii serovar Hurstbridge str. 5399]PNV76843.1 DoxX-like family protein [Leptospira inadai serovar Lyme]
MLSLTQPIKNRISTILSILSAIIFLQTLFFKFTGAQESVEIFSSLGVEPWGRIWTGTFEFLIAILLLIPPLRFIGAMGGFFLMVGAVFSHLLFLGIVIHDDGGLLFGLALFTLVSCAVILSIEWDNRPPS